MKDLHSPLCEGEFRNWIFLVVKVAKNIRETRDESWSLPLLDLIQEGSIGLLKALEKKDPKNKGFYSYAKQYIRGAMMNAILNQHFFIRWPQWFVQAVRDTRREGRVPIEKLKRFRRQPSPEMRRLIEWHASTSKGTTVRSLQTYREEEEDDQPVAIKNYFEKRHADYDD